MAIDRHSSWPDIRLWKQGWTVAINQTGGGIWWQRLNECKKHQSASDYCNCHQIPSRPLTGHVDPLTPHIPATTSTAQPCTPQVLFLEHPWTSADIHTLSTCPFTLAGNSSLFFFLSEWNVLHTEGLDVALRLPHLKVFPAYPWQGIGQCLLTFKNRENIGKNIFRIHEIEINP